MNISKRLVDLARKLDIRVLGVKLKLKMIHILSKDIQIYNNTMCISKVPSIH